MKLFLGRRVVCGPRAGRDWQMAADLRKQLIILQETLSTGLRAVVVRGSVNCLFSKCHVRMWLMRLERKMLRCTEAVEAVQQDWKDRVRRIEGRCRDQRIT